jgi:hypothetical protein
LISYGRSNENSVKLTGSHADSVFLSSLLFSSVIRFFPFIGAQDPCAVLVLSNREGGFESCALSRHDPSF